jgi:hypothetical protein
MTVSGGDGSGQGNIRPLNYGKTFTRLPYEVDRSHAARLSAIHPIALSIIVQLSHPLLYPTVGPKLRVMVL